MNSVCSSESSSARYDARATFVYRAIRLQANQNPNLGDILQRWVQFVESANKKIPDKTIELARVIVE